LSAYGIVHFAAHGVLDDEHPRRTAVLLAPGSPDEDGLLQIREIVTMDFKGKLVVLSSCRSAAGTLLGGEGVMGLARAFFQAGAHAVVGSLWPLRDDDARELFERFYRYLADGLAVTAALSAAQREMMDRGAPTAAWAGVVALGDGNLVPFPGGRPRPFPLLAAAAAVAFLGLLSFFLFRIRRKA